MPGPGSLQSMQTAERHWQRLANLAARLGTQAGLEGVELEAVA